MSRLASPFTLALLFTSLNCLKPLHIDDAAFYYYADQIARRPLDPYDFDIFWLQAPEPAIQILAPPLLPSWWALAIRLFGDQPFLWKLWLLPFSVLFVYALHALLRRFAPQLEGPLLWMTVLSPAFLPSLNLMLDIPALALSLCALAVFFRAADGGSRAWAALAGLIAGLAMQTKYVAFLAPGLMLLYAALSRRLRLGILAASVAVLVFASWEGLIAFRHGESHLVRHLTPFVGKSVGHSLALALVTILGGVGPGVALLGLAALKARPWILAAGGLAIVVGFGLVAAVPESHYVLAWSPAPGLPYVGLRHLIFAAFGVVVCGTTAAMAWRLLARVRNGWLDSCFVVAWLGVEVVGALVISPFPAVRRVMGFLIVTTILAGRLASLSGHLRPPRAVLGIIVAANISLGLVYYAVDFADASAQKVAAEDTARWIREQQPEARVWFAGHWGFQFYAERAGMQPVIPGVSRLLPGDWLVVPDRFPEKQGFVLDPLRAKRVKHWLGPTEGIAAVLATDFLPLRTVMGYYGGSMPLQPHRGPRVPVGIYRILAEFIPTSRDKGGT